MILSPWQVPAVLAVATGAFLVARQFTRRKRRRRRLRGDAKRAMHALGAVHRDASFVGAGNIGAVYSVRLAGDWEKTLGIRWKSRGAFPDRVAFKLASFPDADRRIGILVDIARAVEARLDSQPHFPLCPFLAVGLIELDGRKWLVEVMPCLAGESLRRRLRESPLPPGSIDQLLGVLETVTFLEGLGYVTRSLDCENVLVGPDGRWTRIDIDAARVIERPPLHHLPRLADMTLQVIGRTSGVDSRGEAANGTVEKLSRTMAAPLDEWEKHGMPPGQQDLVFRSTAQLMAALADLQRS